MKCHKPMRLSQKLKNFGSVIGKAKLLQYSPPKCKKKKKLETYMSGISAEESITHLGLKELMSDAKCYISVYCMSSHIQYVNTQYDQSQSTFNLSHFCHQLSCYSNSLQDHCFINFISMKYKIIFCISFRILSRTFVLLILFP